MAAWTGELWGADLETPEQLSGDFTWGLSFSDSRRDPLPSLSTELLNFLVQDHSPRLQFRSVIRS